MDIRITGAELRTAIEAAGIVLDGPIVMRQERVGRRPMLRAMFSIGGLPTEIHADLDDWPPVASSVRGLKYVLANPELPRSEELHYPLRDRAQRKSIPRRKSRSSKPFHCVDLVDVLSGHPQDIGDASISHPAVVRCLERASVVGQSL